MLLTLLTVLSPAVASDGPALAGPPPTTTPAYEIERIPERRRLRRYGVGPAIIGGSVLMAAGAGSAVVGTQCNGSECAVLFVGALGVLPLVGGSLIVTGATAARARALGRRGVAVNSTLGWVAVGLATAGPVVTFVALGTEAWAIPVGIGMSAASLPLAVVQSVRNARAAKDAGLWAAPQLNTRAPGIMLGGHF